MAELNPESQGRLSALVRILDRRAGIYRSLNGAADVAEYLSATAHREDEELVTEPVLADFLVEVLGFPVDGFFPQLGRSGLKPDFTPVDLVAHRYVLDAKSSARRELDADEPQIRRYIDQRRLDFGVLFNLRELRVYRRSARGHDPALSFPLLPLWQVGRGEALPSAEVERFEAFHAQFHHRPLDLAARIARIRRATRWQLLEGAGERLEIDVDYLVDRLRELSRTLADDAAAQQDTLDRRLRLDPALQHALLAELRLLALDVEPGADLDSLPNSVAGFREADGLAGRVWRQYMLRVSQLALTRIVLYRSWEDAGFVDERLYDGGFGDVYERLGRSVARVLDEAFATGRQRYPWLYGESTYDWFRPRDEALVDVLYALLPVPLGKLDADVLGGLYESYVDEIDRDRLGQFYTPRAVVRFMLDRAGFRHDGDGVFELAGDERRPRRVFDFPTGSGGFLVEAGRRIVDEVIEGGVRDADDGLAAIVNGLHGCEISPFPYYLTEVNLLLQASRLLGRLRQLGEEPGTFTLSVVHTDTLRTRRASDESLTGLSPAERADRAELEPDERFGIVPLDARKAAAFERMREEDGFDVVVGNPPYVFESNNRVLFENLRRLPGWKAVYRGKGDYLYYFLLLAAERVRPGGRLAVITPASWMNAGDADWLRARLASTLRLDELFLFGAHRLFAPEREHAQRRRRAPTPTVESAILLATKAPVPAGHGVRVTALEDERTAARALGEAERGVPDRDALLAEMARRAGARGGRAGGIFVHSVPQERLRPEAPWPVKFGVRDLASRVVAHLDAEVAREGSDVEPLDRRWHIFQGIQTGADAYTKRIQRRLSREDRDALAAAGRWTGEPILELPPGREREAPWQDHPTLLARSVEPRAILYGALDAVDYTSLVWIGRGDEVPDAVRDALEPWRRVLATRAEIARNPARRWFETAWPRDKAELRGPKVIALYRTDRGRFAVDESGEWQPSIKTTLCTPREPGLSVAYLCGLLNSELLDLFYAVRGKTPWHVRRNYEPKPMARIPYRHVALPSAPPLPTLPADLLDHCDALLEARGDDAALGAALESVVRALAANRRALLPHRAVASELTRMVKDPWRADAPTLDDRALVAELSPDQTVSVRVDPALRLDLATDGPLGNASVEGAALRFRRGGRQTATVEGDPDRLALLDALVAGRPRLMPAELEQTVLPKDLAAFEANRLRCADAIDVLLADGIELVERAERLVCMLYRVPDELTDEVVAHAHDRARRRVGGGETGE